MGETSCREALKLQMRTADTGNLYISEQGGDRIRVVTFNCVAPVINTPPSSQAVCAGVTNFKLNVSAAGSAPLNYQWKRSGGSVGTNNSAYTISTVSSGDAGNYDVVVNNACGSTTSAPVAVLTVNPLPGAAGIIAGKDSVCVGVSGIAYSVTAITNATGYNWTVPAGATISAGNNTDSVIINYSSSVSGGSITVKGTNGCGSGTQSGLSVTVNPLPNVQVSPNQDNLCKGSTVGLTAGGALHYAWSPSTALNNTFSSFVGANPSSSITYTVTGTDTNKCAKTATAAITVEICTGMSLVQEEEASIHPNPSNGIFSVTLSQYAEGKAELFTLTGQKIYEENFSNGYIRDFNLTGKGGMYILQITSGENTWRRKVLVQ